MDLYPSSRYRKFVSFYGYSTKQRKANVRMKFRVENRMNAIKTARKYNATAAWYNVYNRSDKKLVLNERII